MERTVGSRLRVGTAAVLGVIGLAALATGCGGGSGAGAASPATTTSGTTTTAPGGGGPNSAEFQAYRDCLSAHGVTLPGRPGDGQGGTPPAGQPPSTTGTPPAGAQGRFRNLTTKQRQALTACQSKRPASARGFGGGNANGGPANGAFAKYTACLKSHGVTFGSTSTSSSAFAKATAACKSLLPASTGGSNGGTTTTTP
jgi:hypothetical protein